ncbi:hypothetical protein [Komagataeibacter sp. NFXK3]
MNNIEVINKYKIFITCILISIFISMKYYPGAFYYDIIWQLNWVDEMSNSNGIFFHFPKDYFNQWPVWDVILRIPIYKITKEVGIFILLSSFMLFYTSFKFFDEKNNFLGFFIFSFICAFTPIVDWLILQGPHIYVSSLFILEIYFILKNKFIKSSFLSVLATMLRPEMVFVALFIHALFMIYEKISMKKIILCFFIILSGFFISNLKFNKHDIYDQSYIGLSVFNQYVISEIKNKNNISENLMKNVHINETYQSVGFISPECSLTMWCKDLSNSSLFRNRSIIIKDTIDLMIYAPKDLAYCVFMKLYTAWTEKLVVFEFGRTDNLKISNIDYIKNMYNKSVYYEFDRQKRFFKSFMGNIYSPVFYTIIFVFSSSCFGRKNAILMSIFFVSCQSFLFFIYPTHEVRYFMPFIMISILTSSIYFSCKLKLCVRASINYLFNKEI